MTDGQERKPRGQEVFSITSAPESHTSELGTREKRYAISMGIRTLCFIGAVIVSGPLRWVLIAGAVILPYTAVILANAGVRRKSDGPSPFGPEAKGQIEQ
ncbi:DUF3099 domain-containing protein [Aeromicrobium sp. CF3.5]|uniref:DUF3099 domain-containing protein n=1 Tax=Aeromicrobium sp. CF3.5 TaxID=3373078 RepID=UPI003EE5E40E